MSRDTSTSYNGIECVFYLLNMLSTAGKREGSIPAMRFMPAKRLYYGVHMFHYSRALYPMGI